MLVICRSVFSSLPSFVQDMALTRAENDVVGSELVYAHYPDGLGMCPGVPEKTEW